MGITTPDRARALGARFVAGRSVAIAAGLTGLVALSAIAAPARNPDGAVHVVTGSIEDHEWLVYRLEGFDRGDRLTVDVRRAGGNLDPFVGLAVSPFDLPAFIAEGRSAAKRPLEIGADRRSLLRRVVSKHLLEVDDDGGEGHAARLDLDLGRQLPRHVDPAELVLVVGANPVWRTDGPFRLVVARNRPDVDLGAPVSSDTLVTFDREASQVGVGVDVVTGRLDPDRPKAFHEFGPLSEGDLLSIRVRVLEGDLRPIVILEEAGGKPIQEKRAAAKAETVRFAHPIPEAVARLRIWVLACCGERPETSGRYELAVGVNAGDPDGDETVEPRGSSTLREVPEARVGIRIEQVTGVEQQQEMFGAVVSLRMEWRDARLAFSPEECDCRIRFFEGEREFLAFARKRGTDWPRFTLSNQQGKRSDQASSFLVTTDGQAVHFGKFTASFQAPDFDFRRFPFDEQRFYIEAESVLTPDFVELVPLPGYSGISERHGEEEWRFSDIEVERVERAGSSGYPSTVVRLQFMAKRYSTYYVFRIFLPLGLILTVSWFTLFLRDLPKRIDMAAGNLLLFIAFNFTISGDLPRLAYLTLLDSIFIASYVLTTLVIMVNVLARRLEVDGKEDVVRRFDPVFVWAYPLLYVGGVAAMYFTFG